ncbi:hypothetical protein HDU82_004500 [Entophlyctis luteolus]|nr:hypothetical protein HDU82_004500 [Entophlyctis luteolus]
MLTPAQHSVRIFVGFKGPLFEPPLSVTDGDIRTLFASAQGIAVEAVQVNTAKQCAHVTLTAPDMAAIDRTLALYSRGSGARWRGRLLRVELAQPTYLEKLRNEKARDLQVQQAKIMKPDSKLSRRLKRLIRAQKVRLDPGVEVPVTDKSWKERGYKGWKLVKNAGRAVLVVRMKIPSHITRKKPMKIDPSKVFNKILRLRTLKEVPDVSVDELPWSGISAIGPDQSVSESDATSGAHIIAVPNHKISKYELMAKKWNPELSSGESEEVDESSKVFGDTTTVPDEASLKKERDANMTILRDLLGMNESQSASETRAAHLPVYWREPLRYDPNGASSESLLRDPTDVDSQIDNEEVEDADAVKMDHELSVAVENHEPIPVLESAKSSSYVVNANLRSLVFGKEEKAGTMVFPWLENDERSQDADGPGMQGDAIREIEGGVIKSSEKFSLVSALGLVGFENNQPDSTLDSNSATKKKDFIGDVPAIAFGSSLFFFHFEQPDLMKRFVSGAKLLLITLVPQHIRDIIASDWDPLQSVRTRIPRAVLEEFGMVAIIDISGYSKLSSELEKKMGSDSGAKIKELINPPMELIITRVHEHGGSVVKFAGDAVIASWTPSRDADFIRTEHYRLLLSLNCFVCCLKLLVDFKSYTVVAPEIELDQSLKIHIGIGMGDLAHIHIGVDTKQDSISQQNTPSRAPRNEYFVAGHAVIESGDCLNLGKSGTVVFSEDFRALVDFQTVTKIGYHHPQHIISDTENLSLYLNAAIGKLTRLRISIPKTESRIETYNTDLDRSGLQTYLDECLVTNCAADMNSFQMNDQLRSVTVVFIKFNAFHAESVQSYNNLNLLNSCMDAIVSSVRYHDGTIRQFNCDDKSLTALLCWGLEGMAHEKGEQVLAVSAAVDISQKLHGIIGVEHSIAVTSGVVFSGIVGTTSRCDATVLGVAVNNAARIMSLGICKGIVLCDAETHRNSLNDFKYDSSYDQVFLKGVSEPVRIFQPIFPKSREITQLETDLCGRESEIATLTLCINDWRTSTKPVRVAIIGANGMGKSRLISWVEAEIGNEEIVCKGEAQEHKREIPLYIWTQVLSSLIRQIASKSMHLRAAGKLTNFSSLSDIDEKLTGLAPKTANLLSLESSHLRRLSENIAVNEARHSSLQLSNIITALIQGEVRVCVILDDIQWCDPSSLEECIKFSKTFPTVLFIVGARPLELKEWRSETSDVFNKILQGGFQQMQITAFSLDNIEALIRHTFRALVFKSVSMFLKQEIMGKSLGNPLVAQTLLNAMAENNEICVVEGMLLLDKYKYVHSQAIVTTGAAGAAVAQFDKLSGSLKDFLRVAAVSGQHFKFSEVKSVLNILRIGGTFEISMIEAEDKFKFIRSTDNPDEFYLAHYLIQQGILSSMTISQQETIRKAFVQLYEKIVENSKGDIQISTRQCLVFHLLKIKDNNEKKQFHIYEAFVEATERLQYAEALDYYSILKGFREKIDFTPTFYLKIREAQILCKLHVQTRDFETAIECGKKGFRILLCQEANINPTRFQAFLQIISLSFCMRRILTEHDEAKQMRTAFKALKNFFPALKMYGKKNSVIPFDDEQKVLYEITELLRMVAFALSNITNLDTGHQIIHFYLMLGPLVTLMKFEQVFRKCWYYQFAFVCYFVIGFVHLANLCEKEADINFALIQKSGLEFLSTEQASLYASILEFRGRTFNIRGKFEESAVLFREGFETLHSRKMEYSTKAAVLLENCWWSLQAAGCNRQLVEVWFKHDYDLFRDDANSKIMLAFAKTMVGYSLCMMNNLEKANELYLSSREEFFGDKVEKMDSTRLFMIAHSSLHISACNNFLNNDGFEDIMSHLDNILLSIASSNRITQSMLHRGHLCFLLTIIELYLSSAEKSILAVDSFKQVQSKVEKVLAIFQSFHVTQCTVTTYLKRLTIAAQTLWRKQRLSTFVKLAEQALERINGDFPKAHIVMMKVRIWWAQGIYNKMIHANHTEWRRMAGLLLKYVESYDGSLEWDKELIGYALHMHQ